jgi:hypothetical protein
MWLGLALCGPALGQTLLSVDASAPTPAPRDGLLRMGSAVAPHGEVVGINNRYLTLQGHPWLPVMGEFHYSRSPVDSWADELAKMKSAGVDVVATYVIWNHHEAQDGQFDWKGNRDLRRFVQAAQRAGLRVMLRIGPWDHAEVRYGGVPDWVVDAMPTRSNDPTYLRYVERLYAQIGQQVRGLFWKDGGPIVGVQIENEYNLDGPGQGAAHIATLKALARKVGIDAPIYTVTGWDGTIYPSGEVTPVFGGYPDEPWGVTTTELPPKETYAFRFDSRVSGDLGAQTAAHAPGTAETDMDRTPFLGAEFGAGMPQMYRRRPVLTPDDVASMLPVQLGSGVNLMGYYMFHGGRNPMGGTTLEESTRSGGYNDVPAISYDFNAPLGPDGQQRDVLAALRPFHLFLRDFGDRLAPMTVRRPDVVPANPSDLATPRWSVRADGDAGFVFLSNHVRQYERPAMHAVQFAVKLRDRTLTFPSRPIEIPKDAYFAWPFNFDLDGTRLEYATAQPVARLDAGRDGIVYVFEAADDIPSEFSIGGRCLVLEPGLALHDVAHAGTRDVRILLLSSKQARQLLVGEWQGQRRLVLTGAQAWFDRGGLAMRSVDADRQRVAVFPALTSAPRVEGASVQAIAKDGAFQAFDVAWTARHPTASVMPLRAAGPAPVPMKGGLAGATLQPLPETFKVAAAWQVTIPKNALAGVDDVLVEPRFVGDVGRLFAGTRLVDDWFYDGRTWQVGLRHLPGTGERVLTLTVMPLRADAPIYLDRAARLDFHGQPQLAALDGVTLHPVYRALVR